jgi:hypothetical protein
VGLYTAATTRVAICSARGRAAAASVARICATSGIIHTIIFVITIPLFSHNVCSFF